MSSLLNTLEREIDLISRFICCLDEEQNALKAARPETLPAIHDEKAHLVDQLNTLEIQRITQVGGTAQLPDRERMQVWLRAHPTETRIGNLWQQLIELAQSAKRKNEMNAALVQLHLERTAQALAILTRHAQEHTFYGSNGQASTYTGSRIVDSA